MMHKQSVNHYCSAELSLALEMRGSATVHNYNFL